MSAPLRVIVEQDDILPPNQQLGPILYQEWIGHLGRLGDDLEFLFSHTENHFLSIGADLQDFYVRAEEISKMSATVAALMSGEEMAWAIAGLGELLKKMKGHLASLEVATDQGIGRMQQILNLLAEVYGSLADFRKMVKRLRLLGISTKIESARLGHESGGFDALVDSVAELVTRIESKSAGIRDRLNSLNVLVQGTSSKVINLQSKQRRQARMILAEAQSTLAALTQKQRLSSTIADDISARSADLFQNIGAVVVSMQFHDITRQEMEAVKGSLDDLGDGLKATAGTLSAREGECESAPGLPGETFSVQEVGRISGLQATQLKRARDELVTAVTSIIENLRGIARNAAGMVGETRKLAAGVDETQHMFLDEMEYKLSSVTAALAEHAEISRELSAAMRSVAGTVGDITVFVSDLAEIGAEIELVALNAQIEASHIGAQGAALGVLAEAIQQLSVDARRWTTTVSDMLTAVASTAEEMQASLEVKMTQTQNGEETEVTGIVKDLNHLLGAIQRVNDSMASLLSSIEKSGQPLSDNIERTIAAINVHHEVDKRATGVISTLNEIAGEASACDPLAGQAGGPDPTQKYDLSLYLSELSQDDIHDPKCEVNQVEGDFGANVELF